MASPLNAKKIILLRWIYAEFLPGLDGQISKKLSSPICKNIFVFF
jgi:hypothetical protein